MYWYCDINTKKSYNLLTVRKMVISKHFFCETLKKIIYVSYLVKNQSV